MTPTDNFGKVIVVWFLLNLLFILLWDMSMIVMGRHFSTVSYQMYAMCQKFPLLYLLFGLIIGHLMVPLVINMQGPGSNP